MENLLGLWDHREQKHLKGRGKVLCKFELIHALSFIFPKIGAFEISMGLPKPFNKNIFSEIFNVVLDGLAQWVERRPAD